MASQPEQGKIEPKTIFRHVYGVYPSMAMLAGMQLDVFTPLKDGPMSSIYDAGQAYTKREHRNWLDDAGFAIGKLRAL
jgi:hypothetical protein